ncbi:MAG: Shedu immune nuclease family protein [Candidatus Binatia bacterium]
MKALEPLDFSWPDCENELKEFRVLLDSHHDLSERADILPFFRKRRNLSSFISTYHPHLLTRSLIAYEYPLYGDFSTDLLVGDARASAYCFVEFEDATQSSVFQDGGRSVPYWSQRFLSGYSQLVDWFWKLDDFRATADFTSRFGNRSAQFAGFLVVGRSRYVRPVDLERLVWWRNSVRISNQSVFCLTYDELCEGLEMRMAASRWD